MASLVTFLKRCGDSFSQPYSVLTDKPKLTAIDVTLVHCDKRASQETKYLSIPMEICFRLDNTRSMMGTCLSIFTGQLQLMCSNFRFDLVLIALNISGWS